MGEDGSGGTAITVNARRIRRTVILVVLAVIAVFTAVLTTDSKLRYYYQSDTDITSSTVEREPLPEGSVSETGYYTDELNLLVYESELLSGLKKFYSMTGVQPYVYLTGPIDGSPDLPTQTEMKAFAESKYRELFTDDAHLLLVMFIDDNYNSFYKYWYAVGQQAASVIDTEAGDILGGYLDKCYHDQGLTYEQYFSKVFDLTAERIMSVTVYPLSPFLILLVMLVIAIPVFLVIRHAKKKKQEEARQTEELLKTPLEKFSDKEDHAEKLAKNYDDDPDNDVKL